MGTCFYCSKKLTPEITKEQYSFESGMCFDCFEDYKEYCILNGVPEFINQ